MRARLVWLSISAACLLLIFLLPLSWIGKFGEDYLIPTAFYSGIGFIIYYTLLTPWWHNPMGRMLVSLDAGVVLALLGNILKIEFGLEVPSGLFVRITFAAISVVTVTVLSRTWLLGKLHGWKPRFHHIRNVNDPGE